MKKNLSIYFQNLMIVLCISAIIGSTLFIANSLGKQNSKVYVSTEQENYRNILTPIKEQVINLQNLLEDRSSSEAAKAEGLETIILESDNMVVMDQVFDDQSVQKAMKELQTLSDQSSKDKILYLVLNTPGGSVDAGMKLITFARALPQKVKTLTIFAASMGFITAQHLDERLILENGTLMSHQASFGVRGSTNQVKTRLKWILSMIDNLDKNAAKRMGLTDSQYKELIRDEYWIYDQDAVNDKAADRKVLAKCARNISKSRITIMETMFGNFKIETPGCPLIPGYISIAEANGNTPDERALEYIKLMFTDRNEFTNKYITNNKFEEFLKY